MSDTEAPNRGDSPPGLASIGRVLAAAGGARVLVLPVTGLCNLVIARVVTEAVGIDQFGVVMLVATLSQLLMFADLGAGAAVATARSQTGDRSDGVDRFRGTTLTAIRTTLVAAAVLGVGAGVLGALGAWPQMLGFANDDLASSLNVSAVLALSTFAVALPFAVGEAVLRGGGRMHEAVLLQGTAPPVALALTFAFLHLGAPPLAYALVLPLGALFAAMCCAVRAWLADRDAVRGVLTKVVNPRRYPGLPIAATAVPMFVVMVGLPIALQSDRIIIAHRLDPIELSNYSYASQLYIPLWGVVSTAGVALWPQILGFANDDLASSLNVSAVLALSAFAVALPFAVGEAVLRGGGRMHEAVLLQGTAPPVALVLTFVFLHLGAPPLAYALVLPLGALFAAMCCAVRAWMVDRDAVRGVLTKVVNPRRYPGLPIAATAVPMFVVMVGLPIALQSDRIIIAHRLDPIELSNYSYASQLYIPLWGVVSTAGVALWPHFAKEVRDLAALRKGWLTGLAILSGTGVVIAVCFLLFARYLIAWMSAGEGSPSWSLLIAFAALLLVQAVHVTTGILLIAPDKLRIQAVCVVALVVTNLPLSWVLTPSLGAAGPVYASAITVLVCQLIPGVVVALRMTSPRNAAHAPGADDA